MVRYTTSYQAALVEARDALAASRQQLIDALVAEHKVAPAHVRRHLGCLEEGLPTNGRDREKKRKRPTKASATTTPGVGSAKMEPSASASSAASTSFLTTAASVEPALSLYAQQRHFLRRWTAVLAYAHAFAVEMSCEILLLRCCAPIELELGQDGSVCVGGTEALVREFRDNANGDAIARKLEAWLRPLPVQSAAGPSPSKRLNIAGLKAAILSSMRALLAPYAGTSGNSFPWSHRNWAKCAQSHSIVLVGWPKGVPFAAPSQQKNIGELRKIHARIKSGKVRIVKAEEAERNGWRDVLVPLPEGQEEQETDSGAEEDAEGSRELEFEAEVEEYEVCEPSVARQSAAGVLAISDDSDTDGDSDAEQSSSDYNPSTSALFRSTASKRPRVQSPPRRPSANDSSFDSSFDSTASSIPLASRSLPPVPAPLPPALAALHTRADMSAEGASGTYGEALAQHYKRQREQYESLRMELSLSSSTGSSTSLSVGGNGVQMSPVLHMSPALQMSRTGSGQSVQRPSPLLQQQQERRPSTQGSLSSLKQQERRPSGAEQVSYMAEMPLGVSAAASTAQQYRSWQHEQRVRQEQEGQLSPPHDAEYDAFQRQHSEMYHPHPQQLYHHGFAQQYPQVTQYPRDFQEHAYYVPQDAAILLSSHHASAGPRVAHLNGISDGRSPYMQQGVGGGWTHQVM